MRLILTVLLVASLSGCYQVVNKYDMDNAIKTCGSYEKIAEVSADMIGNEYVLCTDSNYYIIGRPK